MDENLMKRVLPHSIEAEQSVIGSMLMDRDAIIAASEIVTADEFYQHQYGVMFEAMVELFNEGKPVDLVTLQDRLKEKDVTLHADAEARAILPWAAPAVEEDWDREYGDYQLAVKVVSGPEEAVDFIARHGTGHSEAIITQDAHAAQWFLDRVDAAAVYVNASTRFTDGFEFGLGAEIGISTQKLHARGPMGLEELTSTKYAIYGAGQIRE